MFIHCFLDGGAWQEMKCSDDIENKKAFELPKLPAIMFWSLFREHDFVINKIYNFIFF